MYCRGGGGGGPPPPPWPRQLLREDKRRPYEGCSWSGNMYNPGQTNSAPPSRWGKALSALPAVLFGVIEFVLSILIYNRVQLINYNAAAWITIVLGLVQFLVFSILIGMVEAYQMRTISSGLSAGFGRGLIAALTTSCLYFFVFTVGIIIFPPAPTPGSRMFFPPIFGGILVTFAAAFGCAIALIVSAIGGTIGGCIGVVLERIRR
jgi:hypothetical protein